MHEGTNLLQRDAARLQQLEGVHERVGFVLKPLNLKRGRRHEAPKIRQLLKYRGNNKSS